MAIFPKKIIETHKICIHEFKNNKRKVPKIIILHNFVCHKFLKNKTKHTRHASITWRTSTEDHKNWFFYTLCPLFGVKLPKQREKCIITSGTTIKDPKVQIFKHAFTRIPGNMIKMQKTHLLVQKTTKKGSYNQFFSSLFAIISRKNEQNTHKMH